MNADMKTLGAFVRNRREKLSLEQAEVGEAIGRSASWISRFENGYILNFLSPTEIAGLAEILRVRPTDLLTAAGYTVDDHLEVPSEWLGFWARLPAGAYNKLTEEQIDALIVLTRSMLRKDSDAS